MKSAGIVAAALLVIALLACFPLAADGYRLSLGIAILNYTVLATACRAGYGGGRASLICDESATTGAQACVLFAASPPA